MALKKKKSTPTSRILDRLDRVREERAKPEPKKAEKEPKKEAWFGCGWRGW